MRIFESEDLPVIGTKDHEELVRYKSCFEDCLRSSFIVYAMNPLTPVGGFLCICTSDSLDALVRKKRRGFGRREK